MFLLNMSKFVYFFLFCVVVAYAKTTKGIFSENVRLETLEAIAPCESDPVVITKHLTMVKEGNYSSEPDFVDYVFCAFTISGYADENTGRVKIDHMASKWPKQCDMLEVLSRCDKNAKGDLAKTLFTDFFVCFQENTRCFIDLITQNNTITTSTLVEEPVESLKKTTKGIFSENVRLETLEAIAPCESDPVVITKHLTMVKEGNYSSEPDFVDYVFCAFTISGYADENTGRVKIDHMASKWPKQCDMLEVLSRCDKNAKGDLAKTLFTDFFVCFQENTSCFIDLITENNTISASALVEEPEESLKSATEATNCNTTESTSSSSSSDTGSTSDSTSSSTSDSSSTTSASSTSNSISTTSSSTDSDAAAR